MRKKKGFTLVEIMIVVAIIALLAAIAIPNLLRARMNANQANAQATLRTISTALETYATANDGLYPSDSSDFTSSLFLATPSYINKDYVAECNVGGPCQGYYYSAPTLGTVAYNITAQFVGAAGGKNYTITTGGVLDTY